MSILALGVLKICIGLLTPMQRNSLSAQEPCKAALTNNSQTNALSDSFYCHVRDLANPSPPPPNEVVVLQIFSVKLGFLIVLCLVYLFMILSVITGAIIN